MAEANSTHTTGLAGSTADHAASTRPDDDRLVALDVDECLLLLRQKMPKIGRVGFVENGQPIILPVNYALDRGTVVIRTDYGAKFTAALMSSPAAFEVDEVDERWREGWSVLVKGRLQEVTDPDEFERLMRLPLQPWAGGSRNRIIRLLPSSITGRRIA